MVRGQAELANVDLEEVKKLLADIEAEVKPQIMPYYYCDGPQDEKGTWTHLPTHKVMPTDFDPLAIPSRRTRGLQVPKARKSSTPSGPSTARVR